MTNDERWSRYLTSLRLYVAEHSHARVPASYVQHQENGTINLGSWVAYVRQRYRAGLLSVARAAELADVPGWEWGPLQPGPAADHERNDAILTLRSQGVSLQKIGDQFGLTRQRVHQIVGSTETVS